MVSHYIQKSYCYNNETEDDNGSGGDDDDGADANYNFDDCCYGGGVPSISEVNVVCPLAPLDSQPVGSAAEQPPGRFRQGARYAGG